MAKLLDLFCGAGGAAMGYHRAGFEVVGVDHSLQAHYPFEFIHEDTLNFLASWEFWDGIFGKFDVIHASPPCQRFSTKTKKKDRHPDLITPLRPYLEATGVPYVIENVVGAPLKDPIMLCGSSFGLGVQRHRLFESNVPLEGLPCDHNSQPKRYRVYDHGKWYLSRVVPVYGTGGGKAKEEWSEAMGIDWMDCNEMAEAIPPAYTEYIGRQLLEVIDGTSSH